jgi:glycosyltransferase involved in cell wall biosynthesis
MNKLKICYIISKTNKFLAFEWIIDHLDKERYELTFISIGCEVNSSLEQFCNQRNVAFCRIPYHSKKDVPAVMLKVYQLLKTVRPDTVHCHFFEASIIGLTAALLAGIKKRIYTRHHSDFHHQFAPKGVKYDLYCNRLATHIVAISKNVEDLLIETENVTPKKIHRIYHCLDLRFFNDISEERIETVRRKYNPNHRSPVVGIISRQTKWKGIKYTIAAFKEVLKKYPNALLILANAKGDDSQQTKKQLSELPENSYIELQYEHDNAALFKLFDVFVHVPINKTAEAFGLIYIEALATGTPSVFTLSGIASECIRDKENALVVDFQSAEQIYKAVERILEDNELRSNLITTGRRDVENRFSLPVMIQSLEQLYAL